MSLPDNPNTLRETYYSVMAGQNDASILPDIETAPSTENRYLDYIARNGGGGGGDVTKAYVDEQDAKKTDKVTSATAGDFAGLDASGNLTDSNKSAADFATASDMTAVQAVIPSTATTSNKLSTVADTAGEEIASTATNTSITLTDSADGMVQGLTIYGRSEVIEGEIKSVGDDGLTVETCGKNLFGGLEFAEKLNMVSNESIIDTNNKTVSFDHYASSESNTLWVNNTKSNQFTIITTGQVPNEGDVNNSLNIEYDDGTTVSLVYLNTLVKTTKLFITNANKTVKRIFLSWGRGNLATLYYDECGIFEGVKTESDLEPYNGTMATFTTALPLRGVSDTVRDKLICTGDVKQVETVCGEVDLGTLQWTYSLNDKTPHFNANLPNRISMASYSDVLPMICTKYDTSCSWVSVFGNSNNYGYLCANPANRIGISDSEYTDPTAFKAAMSGVMLVYKLAAPTETPLTSAEKSALASLRTYNHTTYIDATDAPTMTVDYLLNTNNGKAVADIQTDLQEQIDEMITVSPLLTLTVAGWDSTTLQQTVTFVHDTTKRNVIDVDPASVEEWAACGIIARYETANNITFTCKSIPGNALLFKVTSMGV